MKPGGGVRPPGMRSRSVTPPIDVRHLAMAARAARIAPLACCAASPVSRGNPPAARVRPQRRMDAAALQQLPVRTFLDDAPFIEHDPAVTAGPG
ncbi:hypothetical protein GQ56_0107580 [Burkholderia paludis]|nr:hypothetical protein GQ56_0107580 [Burkholderia paludis]